LKPGQSARIIFLQEPVLSAHCDKTRDEWGVPDFPANRNFNCDTGFQRFQPGLAIINLQ